MTKGAMLELLTGALDRYESSYRHPAQQKYVRGDLYALYPEGKKMVGECELCWPDDSWPNSKKTGSTRYSERLAAFYTSAGLISSATGSQTISRQAWISVA